MWIEVMSKLLLPILTLVGSGVVSVMVSYRLSSSRDERNLRRSKMEEFFSALYDYCTEAMKAAHECEHALNEIKAGKRPPELSAEGSNSINWSSEKFRHVYMLMSLYFPEYNVKVDYLRTLSYLVLEKRTRVSEHARNPIDQAQIDQLINDIREHSSDVSELKEDIVEDLRKRVELRR